jgi:hypothetical protein
MFVIPPSAAHEEYFRELAESTWTLSMKKHKKTCEDLKADAKTLVVTARGQEEDGTNLIFFLHYRYFRDILYCFVEEPEPESEP